MFWFGFCVGFVQIEIQEMSGNFEFGTLNSKCFKCSIVEILLQKCCYTFRLFLVYAAAAERKVLPFSAACHMFLPSPFVLGHMISLFGKLVGLCADPCCRIGTFHMVS